MGGIKVNEKGRWGVDPGDVTRSDMSCFWDHCNN